MTNIRESVRAVVVDPTGRILLSRVSPLGAADGRELWVTLGGRVQFDEEKIDALRRELAEELQDTECEIGPQIWQGDEVVNWGGMEVRLVEHFYLVSTQADSYRFRGVDEEEIASTHELRWWTSAEIAASSHRFVPHELAALLADINRSAPFTCKHVRLEGPV